jgi:aryl-alcohol dehydrogenase-like predicted oxidoreductase
MLAMRSLGRGGLAVSAVGLGCMPMSEFYGPANEAEALSAIHRALDLGITLLDTADAYGPWHNEKLVGRAIRKRRDSVVLSTKFGIVRGEKGEFLGINGRPEYVRQACDASLQRLDADRIDLYFQHRRDPDVPVEETVGMMAELVARGKVRHIGLSECSAETLRRANAVHPVAAVQSEYSLWTRDPEREVLVACRELGVGFVAYSPLGRGFLTARITSVDALAADDWRRMNPRFEGANFTQNRELVEQLEHVARDKGCRPAQLALAWVLDRGKDVVPIFGTKSRQWLEENVEAAQLELTSSDRERIDEILEHHRVAGERYSEASRRFLDL